MHLALSCTAEAELSRHRDSRPRLMTGARHHWFIDCRNNLGAGIIKVIPSTEFAIFLRAFRRRQHMGRIEADSVIRLVVAKANHAAAIDDEDGGHR